MKRRTIAKAGGYERSLETYLRDIGRISLLTREQEYDLARRIREGDEEAAHDLVRANLRFVVTVAKQYLGQGLSLEDLINEGNIGLMKAATRFDERRGYKFISYAVWWVRQATLQAISDQSRVVRLPQNRSVVMHKVHRTSAQLQQELSRQPRPEEIAERVGFKIAEVREALQIGLPSSCLDEVVSHDDGRTVGDTIADPKREARADDRLLRRSRSEDLRSALEQLPAREAEIVSLYFGLGSEPAMTLERIGQRFGLTRERIRQLKERALGRLRGQTQAFVLMEHYQDS
ncbi:RNA polymerase subunit sigma [bacterium]|nr:MAG: RNA polymerase subunit sigma [bacterium]RKZ17720.1 MAG: RNA polymerase subunit sigma [bacterium]